MRSGTRSVGKAKRREPKKRGRKGYRFSDLEPFFVSLRVEGQALTQSAAPGSPDLGSS